MVSKEGGSDVVVDRLVAEDLAPVTAEQISSSHGVDVVGTRILVQDVRDGHLGPLGGPENDPILQRNLRFNGGRGIVEGLEVGLGGRDGGRGNEGVQGVDVKDGEVGVEEPMKIRKSVAGTANQMMLTKKCTSKCRNSPVGLLLRRLGRSGGRGAEGGLRSGDKHLLGIVVGDQGVGVKRAEGIQESNAMVGKVRMRRNPKGKANAKRTFGNSRNSRKYRNVVTKGASGVHKVPSQATRKFQVQNRG